MLEDRTALTHEEEEALVEPQLAEGQALPSIQRLCVWDGMQAAAQLGPE